MQYGIPALLAPELIRDLYEKGYGDRILLADNLLDTIPNCKSEDITFGEQECSKIHKPILILTPKL